MNWIVWRGPNSEPCEWALLGGTPLLDDAEFEQCGAGAFDPDLAVRLEELERRFDALAPAIASPLARATPEHFRMSTLSRSRLRSGASLIIDRD